jgi:hypothetical protein
MVYRHRLLAQARNPNALAIMDSGFALRAPRNDEKKPFRINESA